MSNTQATSNGPTLSQFRTVEKDVKAQGDFFAAALDQVSETGPVASGLWQDESSTFSGWSALVGVRPEFSQIRFKTRPHDGGEPTTILVAIREDTYDGTILAEVEIPYTPDADGNMVADFSPSINSTSPLVVQWQANDYSSHYRLASGGTAERRYSRNGVQDHVWITASDQTPTWVSFHLLDDTRVAISDSGTLQVIEAAGTDALAPLDARFDYLFDPTFGAVSESCSEVASTWRYQSSTFSGWSTLVGVQPDFRRVKFRSRPHSGGTPTSILVTIRAGSYNGTILGEAGVEYDPDINDYLTADFGSTISSDSNLYLQMQANDTASVFGVTSDAVDTTRYVTGGNQSGSWQDASSDMTLWAAFLADDPTASVSPAGREELGLPAPRLNLAPKYYATTGDVLQIFRRGIVSSYDPYQGDLRLIGESLGDGTPAKNFPRYIEIEPSSTGTRSLEIAVHGDAGGKLASQTAVVEVTDPTTSPATQQRILCVGDSLTDADTWVTEFNRLLTGSGGSPVGKAFSNIEFIGDRGSGANQHEGWSGKDWEWFASNSGSPFINNSVLDIEDYITSNGLGAPTHVYFLLSWNGWLNQLRRNASDWSVEVANAKLLIDAFAADYPSVKVTLMGIPLPSANGGLADDGGDDSTAYGNRWQMTQGVFGLNLAFQGVAADAAYSGFVDFIDLASQVDSEFNMPVTNKAVNTRSAVVERIDTNGIHPDTGGYLQIADAAYRHYASIYCTG